MNFLLGMESEVYSPTPIFVELRLIFVNERVHTDLDHILSARAFDRMFAVLDPTFEREVSRLRAVEAVVEAGVIAVGKGNHELVFVLGHFRVGNGLLGQHRGRDNGHFMTHEGRTTTS